ncbi:MAG TPA: hypothetical protein VGQ46_10070 [Thermoanaerobaculia bacterium]|jgi:hypothetical protein|nr:hypothetical protein [Thermoanaerobaculia bacterium]
MRLQVELTVLAVLTVVYFLLAGGWLVVLGVIGWQLTVIVFSVVSLLAIRTLWRHRREADVRDEIMLYLPLLCWVVAFSLVKILTWRFTQGRLLWHLYGSDKGVANMLFEPAIAGTGGCMYFLHWWMTDRIGISRRSVAIIVLLVATSVAVIVPPIAD